MKERGDHDLDLDLVHDTHDDDGTMRGRRIKRARSSNDDDDDDRGGDTSFDTKASGAAVAVPMATAGTGTEPTSGSGSGNGVHHDTPPAQTTGGAAETNRRGGGKEPVVGDEGCDNKDDDDLPTHLERIMGIGESPPGRRKGAVVLGLSLEAIFHPKFENEHRTDKSTRRSMLRAVDEANNSATAGDDGDCRSSRRNVYVEATLKHSGCLLLWNGKRYYSKNSTQNPVTVVGEAVLRQHFARAWWGEERGYGKDDPWEEMYRRCAEEVRSHNMSLSFELVTSVLGHHGQIPRRDYLVLTAVADLGGYGGGDGEGEGGTRRERFYTSEEMVRFAQRWRLPHNDLWAFTSPDSVERLFELYDETRETGKAGDTVERLTEIAECHVPSMCPHVEFQGDLLEGIVVRLIVGGGENENNEGASGLRNLASASREIVENLVPPSRPPIFELLAAETIMETEDEGGSSAADPPPPPPLLRTDVREVFRECGGGAGSPGATAGGSAAQVAVGALRDVLRPGPGGALPAVAARGSSLTPTKSCDLPGLVSKLLLLQRWRGGQPSPPGPADGRIADEGGGEGQGDDDAATIRLSDDGRTARIAALLDAVGELKLPVAFKIYRRRGRRRRGLGTDGECSDANADAAAETETSESEWVCIVHVRSDSAFRRYDAATSSSSSSPDGGGVMPLYRGFSIRIRVGREEGAGVGGGEVRPPPSLPPPCDSGQSEGDGRRQDQGGVRSPPSPHSPPSLMLKMKFLPYMVRTFICRNGMSILARDGPDGFDAFATNMLGNKWGVSRVASERWGQYLSAWGRYAFPMLASGKKSANPGGDSSVLAGNSDMGDDATTTDRDAELPPLTSDTYLHHLARFDELYHGGHLAPPRGDAASTSTAPSSFRGLVVVVGVDKEQASRAAGVLSRALGCSRPPLDGLGTVDANSVAMATRPVGGGVVCGCGVVEEGGRGMRGLRSLPEKYRDATFVVRVVHTEEEIDTLVRRGDGDGMDSEKKVANQKKKIAGMSRPWGSLKVKATVDVPAKSLFSGEDDSSLAGSSVNKQLDNLTTGGMTMEMSSLVDRLRDLSEALPRPDTRPGLLVFFPAIPGSGKSTLCRALECADGRAIDAEKSGTTCSGGDSKEVTKNAQVNGESRSATSAASSSRRQRPIIVRAGDATKEKYWPLVRREKLDQPFTVYVADKNAPPSVWDTIRDIADVGRSFAVPTIPDGTAVLSTTTVEGHASSRHNKIESGMEGLELATSYHIYPFSLAYLAACMGRVLARPKNSHCGRLDSSVQDACMIVVKFFSLYRGVSAECFVETVSRQKGLMVKVPFFREEKLPSLPMDLEEALLDALRLQYEMDKSNNDAIKESEDGPSSIWLELEARLRSSLYDHRELIDSLTIEKEKSQQAFMSQLLELRSALDGALKEQHNFKENVTICGIKLVAVNVEVSDVHGCLRAEADKNSILADFLERIGGRVSPSKALNNDCVGDKPEQSHFIDQTHVTMAHFSNMSEREMQSEFGAFVGQAVDVTVVNIIFSENVAALSVSSITPSDGATVQFPSCRNDYPHITVWCGNGSSPHQANCLPAQILDGSAQQVAFEEDHMLRGSLSFWKHNSS